MSAQHEHKPVQIFLVEQINSLLADLADATGLTEMVCMRAVSEIIRHERLEEHAAARVFVERVERARRARLRFVMLNSGADLLCLSCARVSPADTEMLFCPQCRRYLKETGGPDGGGR
ncbi:MAG: hypothetical protein H0W76_27035 [Pyrinomonadaceae bacterium]|nr:hypothetical protein [Pyrinomonadaceae bacterium]